MAFATTARRGLRLGLREVAISKSLPSRSAAPVGIRCARIQPVHLGRRDLHNTVFREDTAASTSSATPTTSTEIPDDGVLAVYSAPLAKTFFRLKLFSLGSLALSTALCPVLLLAPAEVGLAGRLGLCAVALTTSGASTMLIAWLSKPYVGIMRLIAPDFARAAKQDDMAEAQLPDLAETASDAPSSAALEVTTTNFRLQVFRTTIYEPSMLRGASRPFTTWELAATPAPVQLPAGQSVLTKLVAATHNAKSGELVGTRWAQYSADTLAKTSEGPASEGSDWLAEGKTVQHGNVPRHFTVHEDKLDERWQVL